VIRLETASFDSLRVNFRFLSLGTFRASTTPRHSYLVGLSEPTRISIGAQEFRSGCPGPQTNLWTTLGAISNPIRAEPTHEFDLCLDCFLHYEMRRRHPLSFSMASTGTDFETGLAAISLSISFKLSILCDSRAKFETGL
jgi:hypothetical protein